MKPKTAPTSSLNQALMALIYPNVPDGLLTQISALLSCGSCLSSHRCLMLGGGGGAAKMFCGENSAQMPLPPFVHNVCAHLKRTGLNESGINTVDPSVGCWHRSRFLALMANYAAGEPFGVQMRLLWGCLTANLSGSTSNWVKKAWEWRNMREESWLMMTFFFIFLINTQQSKLDFVPG